MSKCRKCGAELRDYFLKDGICNGCRNPDLIVRAISEVTTDRVKLQELVARMNAFLKYLEDQKVFLNRLGDIKDFNLEVHIDGLISEVTRSIWHAEKVLEDVK